MLVTFQVPKAPNSWSRLNKDSGPAVQRARSLTKARNQNWSQFKTASHSKLPLTRNRSLAQNLLHFASRRKLQVRSKIKMFSICGVTNRPHNPALTHRLSPVSPTGPHLGSNAKSFVEDGKKWALAETIAAFALALDASTVSAIANDTFAASHPNLARGLRQSKM